MRKEEFAEQVAEKSQISKKQAMFIVDNVLSTMIFCLKDGNDLSLGPLGKFEVKKVASRKGRDFSTGEIIEIPEKNTIKFKPSETVKDFIN